MNKVPAIYRWRFSILLVALLLNILLAPMLTSTVVDFGIITIDIAFTILLMVIVLTVGHNKKIIAIYLVLALITIGLTWAAQISHSSAVDFYRNLFSITILTVAMFLIIKEVFADANVSIDTINGALCAYLLLGFTFISVYALVDIVDPESFFLTIESVPIDLSQPNSILDRVYFSFITMLTVGYGDIVPHSSSAKLFTIIQGFLGQVYLVVMIARLVGMHVSQSANGA